MCYPDSSQSYKTVKDSSDVFVFFINTGRAVPGGAGLVCLSGRNQWCRFRKNTARRVLRLRFSESPEPGTGGLHSKYQSRKRPRLILHRSRSHPALCNTGKPVYQIPRHLHPEARKNEGYPSCPEPVKYSPKKRCNMYSNLNYLRSYNMEILYLSLFL